MDELPTALSLQKHKIMNIPELLECLGNDVEFAKEILQEVLQEYKKCDGEMIAGYAEKDFLKIFLAAHAFRGTCSYLYLHRILDVVHAIRDASILHTDRPSHWTMKYHFPDWSEEEVLAKLKILFPLFEECGRELKVEIEKFDQLYPTKVPETDDP